jgi:hypothetical protein
VAFMLAHCFWLLEFKFRFEFYCLKPFLKKSLNLLSSLPYSFFVFSPTLLATRAARLQQPAQPPARVRRPRRPFGPANRRRQPASPPPPRAAYDRWTPPVIPDLPCPSRTRPRVRLAAAAESVLHTPPPRGPHAKEPRPGYLSRPPPPGSPTQDARRLLRRALAETLAPPPSGSRRRRPSTAKESLRSRARR